MNTDYIERVYAGVMGKLIGVYLGSLVESWKYERIMREVGEVWYYLPLPKDRLLVSTDDDITGTFTFLRALADHGHTPELTSEQIGQSWLNYIINQRTILWWGGLGNSTEHTAYLRLKSGVSAPQSGSLALNGKLVAEQIGAQIFIDGWGLVSPGDPDQASYFAAQAAHVSHDGEAVYAAQVLAAMEAQAFVETDRQALLDCGLSFIPKDSLIFRLIQDLREWRLNEPDWRKTREKIADVYGYEKYGGNCHIIPNHALIQLGFLYGDDDFQKSLMIVNTSGWDTDCNSGNLGCLMGIKNGLTGIDSGPDWRGPLADRLYLPSAAGGRAITDAVTEAYSIVNLTRGMKRMEPIHPKDGARFHFSLPGSLQGFQADKAPDARDTLTLHSSAPGGSGMLALQYRNLTRGRAARAATATFIPPETLDAYLFYELLASPTLYPGQKVVAHILAAELNKELVSAQIYIRSYGPADKPTRTNGPLVELLPGSDHTLVWTIPDLSGAPIFEIGIELLSQVQANGCVYLDYLTWSGEPTTSFVGVPDSKLWQRAWVNGLDHFYPSEWEGYRIVQDSGTGLAMQGGPEWGNYTFTAQVSIYLAQSAGIAVHVQGLRRYYALLLTADQQMQLVKVSHQTTTVLAQTPFQWEVARSYEFKLQVHNYQLTAWIDGQLAASVNDSANDLDSGGIGLVVCEGWATISHVLVDANRDLS